jgi:hypothetical protein
MTITRKRYIIRGNRRMLSVRYGIGWSHGRPDGGAVLKTEVSWRNINGVWINWPTGSVWLLFRRPSW